MGRWRLISVVVAVLCLVPWPAPAQTRSRSHTVRHSVVARSRLAMSPTALSFPSADPDAVPLVPAAGGALVITVKASVAPGDPVTLTVVANDDLRSGLDAIPASALQWTASGTGFTPSGTMSTTVPQAVGSWTGSGSFSGQQSYVLVNSWSYPTGSYSATLTYTLTTP